MKKESNAANEVLKVTFFENRFASDNEELKLKAKEQGRTVARTIHTEISWNEYVDMVLDKSKWREFTASTVAEYTKEKEQFDGVVFAEMIQGVARSAKNVIAHYAIILDIDGGDGGDGGISVEEVKQDLKKYEFVLYSSGGTGIKEGERFRVILPLKNKISAELYNNYTLGLTQRFPYSDESFSKKLQLQYSPMINTEFPELFIAYHGQGKFFNIVDDVELISQEDAYISDVQFTKPEFTDEFTSKLLNALIEHNAGQLAYEERRILANRMASAGINHFDMVQVLDRVGRGGARHTGADISTKANASYGHVLGLRKNLPQDFEFEFKVQPTVIQHSPKVVENDYDAEFWLDADQYVADIADQMLWGDGINLLIADVGTGKTAYWNSQDKVAKVVAPLTSIVEQHSSAIGKSRNNLTDTNIATWNQIEKMMKNPDECKKWILVVDECHGIYTDYNYKKSVIGKLNKAFKLFRKVILMSGTVDQKYFSGLDIKKVFRVHKEQLATKTISTHICKSKDESLLNDLLLTKNKSIVLMNNIVKCEVLAQELSKSGKKCLVINADNKHTEEVKNFYYAKAMVDYDVIIGTNSIVEGVSIEDQLDCADIYIWGDLDPERIEQFTNRFRNVSKHKIVHVYKDRSEVVPVEVDNVVAKIEAAKKLCDAITIVIDTFGLKVKNSYIQQYKDESNSAAVYYDYDADEFLVNHAMIDYYSSIIREHNSANSFSDYASRLQEYGFVVNYPHWRNIVTSLSDNLADATKSIKAIHKIERETILVGLANDFDTRQFKEANECGGLLYDGIYDRVQSLIEKGLDISDAPIVIHNYIKDETYFSKCWKDQSHVNTGSSIRELIIDEVSCSLVDVKGRMKLLSSDVIRIAGLVVNRVLVEFYRGDVDLMISSDLWGQNVQKRSICLDPPSDFLNNRRTSRDKIEVKETRASFIINRYICLDKSKQIRIDGKKERTFEVIHYSLTGLVFDEQNNEDREREQLAAIIASKRDGQSIVVRDETIVESVSANDEDNDSIVQTVKPTNKARAFMKLL
ncbi:DEAD/DEAH box helicase family protein [Yersinia pseudotuberculosis]|uniref:DEAD/DEAH box helicase family protein n=1 Tax=Yersinia pseudotuberculosis TaxID=633 RepID=UPI001A9D0EED|nr:DEAD/DEAH box helicase family protein [Yersinia pseudotuberculosis]MBO1630402.1 DEAD/DEAH box helicase family protein [Yersinia pseudotuberculosis]MBP0070096.1 hypothetical protein [Yersinia pseudotuberculosis]